MRFGSVFLEQKIGFFHKAYFAIFGLPNFGTFVRKRNIDVLLSRFKISPKKILDLGCGAAEFSFYFAEKFPKAKVVGLDKKICTRALASFAKKKHIENIDFIEQSFFDFKQKGFDLIVAIEVFEHLENLEKAIKKTASTLCAGGFLLAHVPSAQWGKFLLPAKFFPKYSAFLKREHKQQSISIKDFCKKLEKQGFKIVFSKKTFGWLAHFCLEIDLLLMEKELFFLRALFLPIFKVVCFFDPFFGNMNGKGILILAQKPIR